MINSEAQKLTTPPPSRWRGWLNVGVFVILCPIVFSLPNFIILPQYLSDKMSVRDFTALIFAAMLLSELIMLGVLIFLLRRENRSLRDLGWRRPTTWYALLIGVLIGLFFGTAPYLSPSVPAASSAFTEISLFRLWAVLVTVFGAFVEETIFRGFVITELDRIKVPVIFQIIVSAFAWALYHAIPAGIPAFIFAMIYGSVFAGLYLLGKRSLTPSVTAHGLLNLISEPRGVLNLMLYLTRR